MPLSLSPVRILFAAVAAALVGLVATPVGASAAIGALANPGDLIRAEFVASDAQHEWVVPHDVTEITIEIAGGSGSASGFPGEENGGVGGGATVTVAVSPGETLFVRAGSSGDVGAQEGGGGSAVGRLNDLIVVVGGGGAGTTDCGDYCAAGGAGGLSATSGTSDARDAGWVTFFLNEVPLGSPGGGATASAPGAPGTDELLTERPGPEFERDVRGTATATPVQSASVVNGDLRLSPRGSAGGTASGTGGTGMYTGGTGGFSDYAVITEQSSGTLQLRGGGGGGSGFVGAGAEVVEQFDNVGDGYVSISYTVPEPEVVGTLEPELTLASATVRAGDQVTLSGVGFDPERELPVILNSDPVLLGTVTTDDEGAFTQALTIPPSVPAGEHVISVGDASIPITVLTAGAAVESDDAAPLAFAADGDAPELVATGSDPLVTSILGALAVTLFAAGAVAVRASRQPASAHRAATPTR